LKNKSEWKFTDAFVVAHAVVFYNEDKLVIADDDGNEVFLTADQAVGVAARIHEVVEKA